MNTLVAFDIFHIGDVLGSSKQVPKSS